jgi:hypothetical protein
MAMHGDLSGYLGFFIFVLLLGGGFLALIVWVILELTKLIKNPSD